jgi:hypothetical protein
VPVGVGAPLDPGSTVAVKWIASPSRERPLDEEARWVAEGSGALVREKAARGPPVPPSPASAALACQVPPLQFAVSAGLVATPSESDSTTAVAPPPAKLADGPVDGSANWIGTLAGCRRCP